MNITHSLICLERCQQIHEYKIKRKLEKYQNTPSNLLIIGDTGVKISKYPQNKNYYFYIFSEVKNMLSLYMNYEKQLKHPCIAAQ